MAKKLEYVRLHSIKPGKTAKVNPNAREDVGDIEKLADSIYHHGLENPLQGTRSKGSEDVLLYDGDRRLMAMHLLVERGQLEPNKLIPVVLDSTVSNKDRNLLQWLLNDGKPLNEFERAEVIRREAKQGTSLSNIADELGKSEGYISQLNWVAGFLPDWAMQAGKLGKLVVGDLVKAKGELGEEKLLADLEARRSEIESASSEAKPFKFATLAKGKPAPKDKTEDKTTNTNKETGTVQSTDSNSQGLKSDTTGNTGADNQGSKTEETDKGNDNASMQGQGDNGDNSLIARLTVTLSQIVATCDASVSKKPTFEQFRAKVRKLAYDTLTAEKLIEK